MTLDAGGKQTRELEKTRDAKDVLARLRRFRGRLPKDFKFDRLEANERGVGRFRYEHPGVAGGIAYVQVP